MTALIILRDVVGMEEMSLFASWNLLCGGAKRFGFFRALPNFLPKCTVRINARFTLPNRLPKI
jgi:hypothetical protein